MLEELRNFTPHEAEMFGHRLNWSIDLTLQGNKGTSTCVAGRMRHRYVHPSPKASEPYASFLPSCLYSCSDSFTKTHDHRPTRRCPSPGSRASRAPTALQYNGALSRRAIPKHTCTAGSLQILPFRYYNFS